MAQSNPTWAVTETLGIRVDAVASLDCVRQEIDAALIDGRPWLCTFVNPASVVLASRDATFAQMLVNFDRVLPDGMGLVMATRWLHRHSTTRISFDSTSLAPVVCALAVQYGKEVAICGGLPGVAQRAAQQLHKAYGIQVIAYDGYSDREQTLKNLTQRNPPIVVVCMGSFKQEQFLVDLRARGWHGVGFTCGGYLDQLAQSLTYYPAWVNRLNLRFAYRLLREPRRLWRRYLLDYPKFMLWLSHDLLIRNQRS